MTSTFHGFSRRSKLTPIPEAFFSDLLPLIDDLAELKITLFCMWSLQQREGSYRYLTLDDFIADPAFMDGIRQTAPDADPLATLRDGLARALTRGSLLCGEIPTLDGQQRVYLMNTERGRDTLTAITQGRVQVGEQVEILPPRPSVFRLYEQEIGALTPLIADGLTDLEGEYSAAWVTDAIRVAAERQARNLKFIRAVLERWRKEGRHTDEVTGRHGSTRDDGDGRQFVRGTDTAWIDH